MTTKICSKCKQEKSVSEYTKNLSKKDKLNHSCKECHNIYTKNHYNKNKKYYVKKARRNEEPHLEMLGEFIAWLKESVPCMDCNQYFKACVMDFDHVRGKKNFNISWHSRGWSLDAIQEEIVKCDLVCSNCHRLRTFLRLRSKKYALSSGSGEDSTKVFCGSSTLPRGALEG